MSVCCDINVEFHRILTPAEITEVRALLVNRLSSMGTDAGKDLWISKPPGGSGFTVDEAGVLYADGYRGQEIPAGAIGGISYLTRYWADHYPDGPLPLYVTTILTLLSSRLVKRVWYGPDGDRSGTITRDEAIQLFEKFIEIGHRE